MRKTIKMFFSCLFVIGLAMMICACGKTEEIPLETASEEEVQGTDNESETAAEEIKSDGAVVVYVCGEVIAPGVYELPAGSRLYQAIDAAGGMTDTAADSYLNQAEALNDGQSIYVPSAEEAAAWADGTETGIQPAAASGSTEDGKVNINAATKEELMTLSGIGEAKASSIIEYRETNGKFQSIEEIKNIPGIKDGVFQKIKDQISI